MGVQPGRDGVLEACGGGGAISVTGWLVSCTLPAASRATSKSVYAPPGSPLPFHVSVWLAGAVPLAIWVPSAERIHSATPLSESCTSTVTSRAWPQPGQNSSAALRARVGGWVSTGTAWLCVPTLPAASAARRSTVWLPSDRSSGPV